MTHSSRVIPPANQFLDYTTDEATGGLLISLRSTVLPGRFALIDPDDIDLIQGYRWYPLMPGRTCYAHGTWIKDSQVPRTLMHRLIMGVSDRWTLVDHKNHDGLDNRRGNLRIVTQQQNLFNQRPTEGSASRFKGVYAHGRHWEASYCVDRTIVRLGRFATEEEAARAYDDAVRTIHGEYAYLNFPDAGASEAS